jgi:signal transduction histidine kinase/DNA-binding response OmpR family regulator
MGDVEGVLAGGGAMGALMRALDWSKTAVGPVGGWPQSLRTALSILLESKFGMMLAWGREFTHFYNDAYRPILGSTKHPSLGRPVPSVFPEIWSTIGPLFEGVMQGQAVGFEDLLVPLDRHGFLEECYFTFSYSPIRQESGAVGGVLVTVTETTTGVIQQRRLGTLGDLATAAEIGDEEQAWQAAALALARNEADVPFVLLYRLDGEGRVATLAATSAGVEPGLAPATLPVEDRPWPLAAAMAARGPVLVEDVVARFGRQAGGKWPEPVERAFVLPIGRTGSSGPLGLAVLGVSPRLAPDDAYREFCSLAADHIAATVRQSRAFGEERRRAEALAEVDRLKTAFFSNMSHEFRTPLTLILAPLDSALNAPRVALDGEDLRAVHRNALRLLKLVNALLEFSRVEAGRAQARRRLTDLAALTREVASAFDSAMERGRLTFEVDCPALPAPVAVDPDMWETIVLNLLSNAFKFTFQGTITVRLRPRGDEVELVVSDTGVGIPDEALPLVFERFRTVPGARGRTQEGSGIGLALVSELARLHGGRVEVQSRLGEGTAFTVTIGAGGAEALAAGQGEPGHRPPAEAAQPYVAEALRWLAGPADSDGPAEILGRDQATPAVRGGGHVLVADDNADMRAYIARLLRPHWSVEEVADGEQALEVLRRRRPDLLITDVMMPGLDGFGLLRAIRESPETATLPVIMLSARAGEESRVEGLQAGADDYLVKPFSARELIARVTTHLELGRMRLQTEAERLKLYTQFMQAPVPLCLMVGPELVYELANPPYLAMLGRQDVVGRPVREVFAELAPDAPVFRMLEDVHRSGRAFTADEYCLPLDRRGTGLVEDAFFSITCQPITDARGALEGVMTVAVDVTPQVVARRQLESLAASERKARGDAELASRAKDEFMAILGHELRNPLAPMQTALRLIDLRGFKPGDLAVMERQVGVLVRLVDDLLDVSRIAGGKIELRKQRLELASVVLHGVETASPLLEERRHRVELKVPAQGLCIEGDADRLSQVVSNLLTNAGKYSEPGSEIAVTAERVDGWVRLRVRDQGIGIAPEMLGQIFEMFVQQPQALDRARGGLGLGLTIVRSLVALHDGRVSATSEGPGRGSEFVVELPLAPTVAAPDVAPRSEESPSAGVRPARILVVDDNLDGAESLAQYLEEIGHQVATAHDGPSALDMARVHKPTICLVDIGLPVMDGYEVARRLRQVEGMPPDLRLIAVTGYGQENDRRRSAEAGFDGHLVKPVDLDALARTLAGEEPIRRR